MQRLTLSLLLIAIGLASPICAKLPVDRAPDESAAPIASTTAGIESSHKSPSEVLTVHFGVFVLICVLFFATGVILIHFKLSQIKKAVDGDARAPRWLPDSISDLANKIVAPLDEKLEHLVSRLNEAPSPELSKSPIKSQSYIKSKTIKRELETFKDELLSAIMKSFEECNSSAMAISQSTAWRTHPSAATMWPPQTESQASLGDPNTSTLNQQLQDSLIREARLNTAVETLQSEKDAATGACDVLASADKKLQDLIEALKTQQGTMQSELESLRKTEGHQRELLDGLWTPIFADEAGSLFPWRARIEEQFNKPGSVARLTWIAIARCGQLDRNADAKELARSLADLSRLAYVFWQEIEPAGNQHANWADEWARAFNSYFRDRIRLRLAKVGEPKDATWMTYGMTTGNNPVSKVESWCVLNSGGNALEKARVV
jgi:hypothetical protein